MSASLDHPTTPPATDRATWRVLVVDDEENLNWSIATSLRKDGYLVDSALSGEDAQRLLISGSYDCVISDIKMPGMDGFDLLQWLRSRQPTSRVIMMTAFGSPTVRDEALRGGVVAYLEKPFDLLSLKEELRRLFAAPTPLTSETPAFDLLEVAQVLNLSRRDIAITVTAPTITGRVRFIRGELVWADAGPLTGDDAFLALCATRAINIQPIPTDSAIERNITQPLSRLIYRALAQRSTTTTGSGPLPPPHTSIPPASSPTNLPSNPSNPSNPAPLAPTALPPDALRALASTLPQPCGLAILRPDGSIIAQSWLGMAELPLNAYTHLLTAAQAAARAALLADLGLMRDLQLTLSEHTILFRRLTRSDRVVYALVTLPLHAAPALADTLLRDHLDTLLTLPR